MLLLSVLMVVFCLTRGANPVPGYTPPHDSDYYAQHLDELAQELNANVLPVLDETAHAEAGDGTVTVTASGQGIRARARRGAEVLRRGALYIRESKLE